MTSPTPTWITQAAELAERATAAHDEHRAAGNAPDLDLKLSMVKADLALAANARTSVPRLVRELIAAREALVGSREALSIAKGWARSKPDSQRARDKIDDALLAIRAALSGMEE